MSNSPVWPTKPHNPTAVRLYGVDLEADDDNTASIQINFLRSITGLRLQFTRAVDSSDTDQNDNTRTTRGDVPHEESPTIAVIYAYAFEGHCYRLDKPKIMVFNSLQESEPALGCGFDAFRDIEDTKGLPSDLTERWQMWLVDKLDRAVELAVNQGFIEELILEANMPGKRSPTTYSANMQVAHRGGRLTD